MAIKRLVDILGSAVGLILLSPLLLVLSLLVRRSMGPPVFFRQVRPGKDARPFRLWKFRTMTNARDSARRLLPDRERLTKLGTFMRTYSLDELPQLINVLIGDMSLVGPRPLLMRYVPRYNERQRLRLSVKPGITGLAQLSGRNALDWDARLELDASYAERVSFLLDMRLILMTIWKVAAREGVIVSAANEGDEFWGTLGKPPPGASRLGAEEDESVPLHAGVPAKQMR
jgi:lipopolysaccharide/colanic/teichoic acid biosynthesis glycosyltransferase